MITLTTFGWVPDFAQGLVRDLRVRWALEEAGLPYRTQLIDFNERDTSGYRSHQPFGQVPVYEEDGFSLFESGSIVLHIAARTTTLLPADPHGKARAITWVLAALNTVEVAIQPLGDIDFFLPGEEWARQRRPEAEKAVRTRLTELASWLGEREYLEDRFTAGDLMMTTVLRTLRHTNLVEEQPNLRAYQARCEARPAFQKALRDHMQTFEAATPAPV